jgi:hypothetical protein
LKHRPALHHLHERHERQPDEDGRQDRGEKTHNHASFGGSIFKANMEVEAAIELGHDLDASYIRLYALPVRDSAWASCWIARFLLGFG